MILAAVMMLEHISEKAAAKKIRSSLETVLLRGDVLTPEKIFDAMEALEAAITADSIYGYGLRSKGQVGVLYIEVDYDTGTAPANDTVGVLG